MSIVAGVDFGTRSVHVTLVDTNQGKLGSGVAEYPLHRRKEDPGYATESHDDHKRALGEAIERALGAAKVPGNRVAALAIDTTGSGVIAAWRCIFRPSRKHRLCFARNIVWSSPTRRLPRCTKNFMEFSAKCI